MIGTADREAIERLAAAVTALREAVRTADQAGAAGRLRIAELPMASAARVRALVEGLTVDTTPSAI